MAGTQNAVGQLARLMQKPHVAQAFEMVVTAVNGDGTVNVQNGTNPALTQVPVVGPVAPAVGDHVLYLVYDKRGVVLGTGRGAQGPQGIQGPQGPQGPAGPAGTQVVAIVARSGNEFSLPANTMTQLVFQNGTVNVGPFVVTGNWSFQVPWAGVYRMTAVARYRSVSGTGINVTVNWNKNQVAQLSLVFEKVPSVNELFMPIDFAVRCVANDYLSVSMLCATAGQAQGVSLAITYEAP